MSLLLETLTALQLLSYLVRIWEQRVREGASLCPIIPLVIYHGESRWSAARSIEELIGAPEELAEYQVRFRMNLLDLSEMADDAIPGEQILRSTLQLLKYASTYMPVFYKASESRNELSMPGGYES